MPSELYLMWRQYPWTFGEPWVDFWYISTTISYLMIFGFKLQMRGTRIHLWLLITGELACDLKSVISEAVSWKSSRNHNISYFNRTNNLPLIYLYVWLTLLDWIQFAIDDLISGHICFHSYHCCVHVWKVTSIQFRFRDILCWTYWCVVNVGWWMFQGKEPASKANFSPMQCRFGFCRVEKVVWQLVWKFETWTKVFLNSWKSKVDLDVRRG